MTFFTFMMLLLLHSGGIRNARVVFGGYWLVISKLHSLLAFHWRSMAFQTNVVPYRFRFQVSGFRFQV